MRSNLAVILTFLIASSLCGELPHPIPPNSLPPSRSPRIIDGTIANNGDFPWQVLIKSALQTGFSICGGFIISSTHVLTAAHCTQGFALFTCQFGSVDASVPLVTMNSSKRQQHEKYDASTLNNDISIIFLPVALTFNERIATVLLPVRSHVGTTFLNQKATASGFGRTISGGDMPLSNRLWSVDLRVISNSECEATYGKGVIVSSTLCTRGWDRNGQSVCQGDDGGALVLNNGVNKTAIGVISFVSSRGCGVDPSGFVRITPYLDWIAYWTGLVVKP